MLKRYKRELQKDIYTKKIYIEVERDRTAPEIEVIGIREGGIYRDIKIDIKVKDKSPCKVKIRVNGKKIKDIREAKWEEGENELIIKARDARGNVSKRKIRFTKDTIPPRIKVNIPDSYMTNKEKLRLKVRVNEVAEITINGEKIKRGKRAKKILQLREGDNEIEIKAKDLAGNESKKVIHIEARYDIDGDGLSDEEEKRYGCDPSKRDTDGDGLSDGEEIKKYHTNPLEWDTDGDRLTDEEEVKEYRTDPLKEDTDADGISDAEEVWYKGSDPLKKDTDGDGIEDGIEVNGYLTDPTKKDTDGDGLNDREEIEKYNTDPSNKDTDYDGINDREEIAEGLNPRVSDTDGDGATDGIERESDTDAKDAAKRPEDYIPVEGIKDLNIEASAHEAVITFRTEHPMRAIVACGIRKMYSHEVEEEG